MSTPPYDPGADDEPLARPFLAAPPPPAEPQHSAQFLGGPADPAVAQEVRPYVMTAGRTRVGGEVALESLVVTTTDGRYARASYEAAQILQLCEQMQSVAEVSAHLRLPVGVARVLVADLAAAGLLAVSAPPARDLADDVDFLERLILGVAAL
jgi:Protein of unknown function (DUF742)